MSPAELPQDFEARMKEWGRYFGDRRRLQTCGSAEKNYKRRSDDPDYEPVLVRDEFMLKRVLATHEAIQAEDRSSKWALTLNYCYRQMQRGHLLGVMRKMTGRRLGWYSYLDLLDSARIRVYCRLI